MYSMIICIMLKIKRVMQMRIKKEKKERKKREANIKSIIINNIRTTSASDLMMTKKKKKKPKEPTERIFCHHAFLLFSFFDIIVNYFINKFILKAN